MKNFNTNYILMVSKSEEVQERFGCNAKFKSCTMYDLEYVINLNETVFIKNDYDPYPLPENTIMRLMQSNCFDSDDTDVSMANVIIKTEQGYIETLINNDLANLMYLPTQTELINMYYDYDNGVKKTFTRMKYVNYPIEILKDIIEFYADKDISFTSLEELYLCVVMMKKFNKMWNNNMKEWEVL